MSNFQENRTSPYQGLEPFDERDEAFFFGRDRETRLITANLFASRLTLLYGASGVGKSSVLRAGLLPKLRLRKDLLAVAYPAFDASRSVVLGWQFDPLDGIKSAVAGALLATVERDQEEYLSYQATAEQRHTQSLNEFLVACYEVSHRRIMLILDQFEEYPLYHPDYGAFDAELAEAVNPDDYTVSFLISLREDSLAKLDRFKGTIPTLWDSYRRIEHLSLSAAEDAVRLPLGEYNRQHPELLPVAIEKGLVDQVLFQVQAENVQFDETGSGTLESGAGGERRIETPYLQLVMSRIWEREQAEGSRILRAETLAREGGAAEIVRTHLDRVMEQFSPEERDIAAKVFHRLVTPSGAKIAFSASDLAEYEVLDIDQLANVLRRLEEGSRRILRRVATRGDSGEDPLYEIFHDRLGKAILSWRSRRMQEQERERHQREEVEQRQIEEQTTARFRGLVNSAMEQIGHEGQILWSRIMFYLITDGQRIRQTASDLAALSEQPRAEIEALIARLINAYLVTPAFGSDAVLEPVYEIAHDAFVPALQTWHSEFVVSQSNRPAKNARQVEYVPSRDFPFERAVQGLLKGKIVPMIGAGVSLSARPQPGASTEPHGIFVPSAREFKGMLATRCRFPTAEFEHADVAEVASYFVDKLGRRHLDELIHEMLGRADFKPSKTHRFLARIAKKSPIRILSTNYDPLMEQVLGYEDVTYNLLAYINNDSLWVGYDAAKGRWQRAALPWQVVNPDIPVVVRLNGPAYLFGDWDGTYAITEEDQLDWLGSLRDLPLEGGVREARVLSLGQSGRDWSQRAFLRRMYGSSRGLGAWAVALNPSPVSVATWQRYNVEVFNMDLNEWADRMNKALDNVLGESV